MFKKLIALSLAAILLLTCVPALAESYADKSTDELYAMIADLQWELFNRAEAHDDSKVLYSADGLTISIERAEFRSKELYVYLRIVNDTDAVVDTSATHITVNGCAVNTGMSSTTTTPGERRKDCYIRTGDLESGADITDASQIVNVDITLYITMNVDGSIKRITTDPIPCIYNVDSGLRVVPQE